MKDSAVVKRFIQRQSRLHAVAHKQPSEIKYLGFEAMRVGIDKDSLYASPSFMALPFEQCPFLNNLSQSQLSTLTAMFFAHTYAGVSIAEQAAVHFNMRVADMLYSPGTDPWMLLFNETGEEYDHICCFRSVFMGFTGECDIFDRRRFQELEKLELSLAQYAPMLDDPGNCALILLVRYLLNLSIKQTEAYLFDGIDQKANANARLITQLHSTDEARHLTTSIELGVHLFSLSKCQSILRMIFSFFVQGMISDRFSALSSGAHHARRAFAALEAAFQTPAFDQTGSAKDLISSWEADGLQLGQGRAYVKSQRWLAHQIADLVRRLDLDLSMKTKGFSHYQRLTIDNKQAVAS